MKREYTNEEKISYFNELLQLELAKMLVANARFKKRIAHLEGVLNRLAEKTPKGGKES